ncbi:MAG: RsmB/NOP family class I SAM-dependent RNA methyltransferase [Candidatus Kapabacteria bacterium]|nr:RsmB/NOP family class I SAM-dependent RNA methyltransferase [Candidatus Kapabacteria bacterium]
MPIPASLHGAVRDCVYDTLAQGRHLTSSIERLFRDVSPTEDLAAELRRVVFQAVRYDNVEAALAGELDGVVDPSRAAIPEWLGSLIAKAYPETFTDVIARMLSDAPVFVRINTLRTTRDACMVALMQHAPHAVADAVLRIDRPFGLFTTEAFAAGWFEQQDITSVRAGYELAARPSERIIDACAGAGGKSLLFACSMLNRGRIIALDVVEAKLDALRTRATRAGVDIIETRHIVTTKTIKRLAESADAVFVDVPCTGTGVLRRNPDILYHRTQEGFAELLATQQAILRRSAAAAKPGGRVVYAACSILPEEGADQVATFLSSDQGAPYRIDRQWQTLPGDDGGDGFYVAHLTRQA